MKFRPISGTLSNYAMPVGSLHKGQRKFSMVHTVKTNKFTPRRLVKGSQIDPLHGFIPITSWKETITGVWGGIMLNELTSSKIFDIGSVIRDHYCNETSSGYLLTARHRAALRNWAAEHRDRMHWDWSQVLLTDESVFILECDDRRVLLWLNSNWTAEKYANEVLCPYVVPFATGIGDSFPVIKDNARNYTADFVENFLVLKTIQRMEMLACCHDLNLIQHV
ncbi:hypothetical protein TNCV_1517801 [Trichonephila clavipes]|nr:hypothetical protein TNCV_1517801 [Trichonephila clavipes]